MIYAQFFQKSAAGNELVEACGDRSVVILDGRSPSLHPLWAKEECLKRGYLAWQIFRGESFTRSRSVSDLHKV